MIIDNKKMILLVGPNENKKLVTTTIYKNIVKQFVKLQHYSICKTHVFKVVLFLILLNTLGLLIKVEENYKTNFFFPISQLFIYLNISIFAPTFGAFLQQGALGCGLSGLGLGQALIMTDFHQFSQHKNSSKLLQPSP